MTKPITEYITDFCSCLAANNLLKIVSGNKANNSSNYDKQGNRNKKPEVLPPSNPAGSVCNADVRYKKKLFADEKNAVTDPSQKTLVQSMIDKCKMHQHPRKRRASRRNMEMGRRTPNMLVQLILNMLEGSTLIWKVIELPQKYEWI